MTRLKCIHVAKICWNCNAGGGRQQQESKDPDDVAMLLLTFDHGKIRML
jgi:hypothetical protein